MPGLIGTTGDVWGAFTAQLKQPPGCRSDRLRVRPLDVTGQDPADEVEQSEDAALHCHPLAVGVQDFLGGGIHRRRCLLSLLLQLSQQGVQVGADEGGHRLLGVLHDELRSGTPLSPGSRRRAAGLEQRRPVLTTQLYFRGERGNASDGIFVPELLVRSLRKANGRWSASFDFVLEV